MSDLFSMIGSENAQDQFLNLAFQGEIKKKFQGNSGLVYLVKNDSVSPKFIAYKRCKYLTDEGRTLFEEEIMKWNSITSRYIVPIFYVHIILNEYFACMRACHGSLVDLMQGSFDETSAYVYALQLVKGMIDINNSSIIYHQDLNPQNILYEDLSQLFKDFPSNNMHPSHRFRLMISDFAMSNYYIKNNIDGKSGGKFPFKAPEQYSSTNIEGFKPDHFALGVILCMLFTNKHPCGYQPNEILRKNPKKLKTSWESWAVVGKMTVDFHNENVANLILSLLCPEPNARPDFKRCFEVLEQEFQKHDSVQCEISKFYIEYFEKQSIDYPREKINFRLN
ncbi:protein kinase [Pantoea osteomyelitidis]|uniref:Protein kinase n=1 Tax=Pantoea osteomyelitidis TaxID=3230026 RepID=A0ABW7Q181_9GAMM